MDLKDASEYVAETLENVQGWSNQDWLDSQEIDEKIIMFVMHFADQMMIKHGLTEEKDPRSAFNATIADIFAIGWDLGHRFGKDQSRQS